MVGEINQKLYFEDNLVYVSLLPHQGDIYAHKHAFYELVFFEYGLLNHSWEGERSILIAGDLFCIRPGETHLYTRSKGAKIYNCLFFLDALPKGIIELSGVNELLFSKNRVRLHTPMAMQHELKCNLQRMITELEHKSPGYNEVLSMLLGVVLIFAGRLYDDSILQVASYAPEGKLKEALAFLEANYEQKLKIEEVALAHDLNPEQFSRLARQLIGITPLQYLQNIRLGQAMELLLEEDLPIGEVAYLVGFEDANYFSRLFRRHVGVSPSKFRTKKGL